MNQWELDFIHEIVDQVSSQDKSFTVTEITESISKIKPDLGVAFGTLRNVVRKEINGKIRLGEVVNPLKGKYIKV